MQGKLQAAAKWMEAVKSMEQLASFSRSKMKNFEKMNLQKEVKDENGNITVKTMRVNGMG